LRFGRVITRIENPDYETICPELELEDLIIPSRTTGLYLADLARDRDFTDYSSYRDGKFLLTGNEDKIHEDDEIVLLTDSENLEALQDRWSPDRSGSPHASR